MEQPFLRTALAHHWLVRMRGGEKVLEAIAELFPDADLFTLFHAPAGLSEPLRRRRTTASWLNRLPLAARIYPNLLPLYPLACRSLDARGYDLVISSDSSLIKGIRIAPCALHICYCHSPPRYLWQMTELYLKDAGRLRRLAARAFFPRLRRWDRAAAQHVTHFVANSEHTRRRIRECYDRDATVICPPVDAFEPEPAGGPRDYYLVVGHLTPYKRVDLAVEAAARLGRRLVIIGDGPERKRLERSAGPLAEFLGWQPTATVRRHLASCRALLFPGEEDFGIVPVEAQMAGTPVIAYGAGGALETVVDGTTGFFFEPQTADALADAILRFERAEPGFSRETIRRNALRFEKGVFLKRFGEFVREKVAEHQGGK